MRRRREQAVRPTTTMERARLSANHANQASIVEKSPDLERLCEQHMEKIATINVTVPSMSKKGIPSVVVVADVIVWR
jgi:hypothetical protein